MADSKTIQVKLKTVADIGDVQSNIKEIQKAFNGLSLPKGLDTKLANIFANVEKNAEKASQAMASGFKNKGDVTAYEKATNQIVNDMKSLSNILGQIDTSKLNFEIDPSKVESLVSDIKRLKEEINQIRTDNLTKLEKLKTNAPSKAQAWKDFFDAFAQGDEGIEDAEKALKRLQTQLEKAQNDGKDFSEGSTWDKYKQGVETCEESLALLKGETGEAATKQAELNQKTEQYNQLQAEANQQGTEWLNNLSKGTAQATEETDKLVQGQQKVNTQQQQLNSELEQFKSKVTYFFGMNNAVSLFQRAIQSAYETVKDLDEIMTETAVVTNFSVGDMWSQLPEYTQRANELGISIHSAYEAATLYYQQGLSTNEVVAVSNETLKMARIAGLDAATATDRMTNALRGFNMEINEANAQNINDVYSKLAAITASDVDEISTAMTKVASLANNANMSFESTAAFLSQIIETTRESAETAGTALKTVVARFSEVKDLYSEGELLGTDSEGEEIDVNKVSAALRTAGINLNEYLTGAKGLDEIFMELSSKWDSLDQVQQRYIATMAAGSRQQSRFIALMSDYARTTELVNAANNASGASQEQFNKTLESLETKLNKLQNAWDEFLMSIADSDLIKDAIDLLTNLISTINDITSGLGKLSGVAKVVLAVTLLKAGKAAFNGLFSAIGAKLQAAATQSGKTTAVSWIQGFKTGVQKNGGGIGGVLKTAFTNAVSGEEWGKDLGKSLGTALTKAVGSGTITSDQAREISVIYKEQGFEAANAKAKEYGATLDTLDEKAKQFKGTSETTTLNLQAIGTAAMAAGGAITMLGQLFNDGSEEGEKTAKVFSTIGTIIMGVGTAMTALGAVGKVVGVSISTSMWAAGTNTAAAGVVAQIGWGWISLIMIAIAALIALVVAGFKAVQAASPEGQLKAAEEAAEAAATAAQHAADAFENLSDSWDSLSDGYTALEDMVEGTQEWKDEVQSINEQVLELMSTYEGLNVVMGENGVLEITNMEEVLAQYQARSIQAASVSAAAEQRKILAENKVVYSDLGYSQAGKWVGYGDNATWVGSQSVTEDIARQVAQGNLTDQAEITKYLKENYAELGLSIDADIEALNDFGKSLLENDKQLEQYYTSMASNALQLTELTGEDKTRASNYLSADRMETISKEALSDAESINKNNRDKKREEYAQLMGYSSYSDYKDENGDISDKDLRAGLASAQATEDAAQKVEDLTKAINSGKFTKAQAKIYDKQEGQALNQNDLAELAAGKTYTDIKNATDDALKTIAETAFNNLDAEAKSLYAEDGSDFIEEYVSALKLASETYYQATKDLTDLGIDSSFSKSLSASSIQSMSGELVKVFQASGSEAASSLVSAVTSITDGMSDSEANTFVQTLSTIDWSNVSQVEEFSDTIKDLGLTTNASDDEIDALEQQIIMLAKASKTVDFTALQEQIQELSQLSYELSTGEKSTSFSTDQMEQLIEAGAAEETDFSYNIATGTWDYIAGSAGQIVLAIQQQTRDLLDSDIDTVIKSGEAFEKALDDTSFYSEAWQSYEDAAKVNAGIYTKNEFSNRRQAISEYGDYSGYLAAMQVQYDPSYSTSGELDIDNIEHLYNLLTNYNKLAGDASVTTQETLNKLYAQGEDGLEQMQEIYEKAKQTQTDLPDNIETRDTAELQNQRVVAQWNDPRTNAELISSGEDTDIYGTALLNQATAAGVATEKIQAYRLALDSGVQTQINAASAAMADIVAIYQEAQALEVDTTTLEEYAKALQEANKDMSDAETYSQALHDINLNTGYKKLVDEYEDWCGVLFESNDDTKKVNKSSTEYREALTELSSTVSQMLGTVVPLNSAFFESEEVMGLVEEAALGDVDAIDKLRILAADQLLTQFIADLSEADQASATLAANGLQDIVNKFDNLAEISGTDAEEFKKACEDMISAAGLTAEQVSAYFAALGYDVNLTTVQQEVEGQEHTVTHSVSIGGASFDYTDSWKDEDYTVEVPVVESLTRQGSSGGKINSSTVSTAKSNTKGGSTKDTTTEKFENPYTELYNINEELNEQLRTREKLERKYQATLKDEKATVKEIRDAYQDQIDALEKEKAIQTDRANTARGLLNGLTQGSGAEYAGMEKYATYSNGEIHINWDKLEDLSAEEGERAEEYIKYLEEYSQELEDAEDALYDIQDSIDDIQQQSIDSYLSFEERVMDAYISAQEKEIDALEETGEAIDDANSKLISKIQEQINEQRQARSNADAESDILDKESRLAYLKRDTSGANQLEILQLEQELEEARQDYSDSLIDQALEQMQSDADTAAEQRATQIQIMRDQLENQQDTGELWDHIHTLMNGAINDDGTLNNNSALVDLLKSEENFESLSSVGKSEWWKNLKEAYAEAIAGDVDNTNSGGSSDTAGDTTGSATTNSTSNISTTAATHTDQEKYGVALATINGNYGWGNGEERKKNYKAAGFDASEIQGLINSMYSNGKFNTSQYVKKYGLTDLSKYSRKALLGYAKGGLADYTGPAWLDGTKSNPEMVLSATDTRNFMALRDILAKLLNNGNLEGSGDAYYDIDINAEISSDYDVDQLADKIKKQITDSSSYRNVNTMNFLR